jgi:regulator of sigma E protease
MDFIAGMGGNLWSVVSYAGPFLFVLCLVVFIHELGHFLVGRWCGVKVNSFSIGFGPELIGFFDKHGTRWKISAIPLGGYVKFHGDLNVASAPDFAAGNQMSEEEKRVSFPHKAIWQRALIVAAGPIANFILAIILFAGLSMVQGRLIADPYVGGVVAGSAAERAGFQVGDKILRIDGNQIVNFEVLQRLVSSSPDVAMKVVVMRGPSEVTLSVTPELKEIKSRLGIARIGQLGLRGSTDPAYVRIEKFGPLQAIAYGATETWFVVERTLSYIGKLVIGRESADQLSGLPRIVQASGEVTKAGGFGALLGLTALMSVSIGLLNLFPIPMLDGGHLVFYAYEWVRKRPLSERKQEIAFRFGFALVIGLMVFATWNDILHFVSL